MRKPSRQQRLSAKNRSKAMLVGITWYTGETWAQVKATASDPECFEDTFEKWKAIAVSTRREFQRSGVQAIECQIVPEEFAAWCAQNNRQNNSASRSEYVSVKLSEG